MVKVMYKVKFYSVMLATPAAAHSERGTGWDFPSVRRRGQGPVWAMSGQMQDFLSGETDLVS